MKGEVPEIKSQSRPAVYQLGARVWLSVREANSEIQELAVDETRRFDTRVGPYIFSVHQIAIGNLSNPINDLFTLKQDWQSLSLLPGISNTEWRKWLRYMLETVARFIPLRGDDLFIRQLAEYVQSEGPIGQLRLIELGKSSVKIVAIQEEIDINSGDLLVIFGKDKLILSRVDDVYEVFSSSASGVRIFGFRCQDALDQCNGIILGRAGSWPIVISGETVDSFNDLYDKYESRHFDLVAVAASLCGIRTWSTPDTVKGRSQEQGLRSERLGFRFKLNAGLTLKHGFFACGWYEDPEGALSEVTVVDHSLLSNRLNDIWVTFPGQTEIEGKLTQVIRFVAFIPRRRGHAIPFETRLRLTLIENNDYIFVPFQGPEDCIRQRDIILRSIVPASFNLEQFTEVYRPAIEPLQIRVNALQGIASKAEFGERSSRRISVIVPIYREIAFLRSQLLAFSGDPFVRDHCELIYVVDDPTVAPLFLAQVSDFASVFPLDVKVLSLKRNGGYGLANNIAVHAASGPTLLLMNSDVVPAKRGWAQPCETLLMSLPKFSSVGPKLTYPDGSLQHAGMYFARTSDHQWQNVHYFKGYDGAYPAVEIAREVPALSGACLFVRRQDFVDVGGFSENFIIADFEDSDLCLKLRARGGEMRYSSSGELIHFERQSVGPSDWHGEPNFVRYNRALHTVLWNEVIPTINELSITVDV